MTISYKVSNNLYTILPAQIDLPKLKTKFSFHQLLPSFSSFPERFREKLSLQIHNSKHNQIQFWESLKKLIETHHAINLLNSSHLTQPTVSSSVTEFRTKHTTRLSKKKLVKNCHGRATLSHNTICSFLRIDKETQ
ncbi:hypothetical protein Droror1_Dr00012536 [Drosera rotundifolia]